MFGLMSEQIVLDSAQTHSAAEREQLRRMFELAPGFAALLEGHNHDFVMANPAFVELVGKRQLIGKSLARALPELAGQEFGALLDAAAIWARRWSKAG